MNAITQINGAYLGYGISNADYHKRPEISSSGVKTFMRSPLHYWAEYLDPARVASEPSESMQLGSVVHTLLLEPELFASEYVVTPDINRRTKEGKAEYEAFMLANAGKTLIGADMLDKAQRIVQQLQTTRVYERVIAPGMGIAEASIFFTDPATGVQCRVRPDYHVSPCEAWPNGLIVDLKTAEDARPAGFARACANFGYDLSAAMYAQGFQAVYGTAEAPPFLFLVAENRSPFAVATYSASEEMLFTGQTKLNDALSRYARCLLDNSWPGYSEEIQFINLPRWAS